MPRWKPGQFPEGPPENYNPEDPYADPVPLVEHREYNVRQKAIQVERAKLIREKLILCYKEEGVNQAQNCRDLAKRYMEEIKDIGVHRANSGRHDHRHLKAYDE